MILEKHRPADKSGTDAAWHNSDHLRFNRNKQIISTRQYTRDIYVFREVASHLLDWKRQFKKNI